MTAPPIQFIDETGDQARDVVIQSDEDVALKKKLDENPFPPPIIKTDPEHLDKFVIWLDNRLTQLISEQSSLQDGWSDLEDAYRALPGAATDFPFKGACKDTIPVIAMAVDPIHARLDTGIFKQDPVFNIKGLKKKVLPLMPSVNRWVDYYQKHKLKLRQVSSPAMLESAKLGTMIFKTVFDVEKSPIKTYDAKGNWKVITKELETFRGPRVFHISIGDALFPPRYQNVQDVPIFAERQRTTFERLKIHEAAGKITDVDKLIGQDAFDQTALEAARSEAVNHEETNVGTIDKDSDLVVYEIWCDFDINGDGIPEKLVCTFHKDTRTILQLRYNWYFHQRKPYTVIPYTVSNNSLYGIGISEMTKPFQDAITIFHRMASDNAYLANIRMFIAKTNSGIEEVPRLYTGRTFFVDDPKNDFIPFAASDIYPSTIIERQNLFGMSEKRTGVSDYLTGRESPVIGSRATATSTLALIQEGTRRVEEVLENIRVGYAEILENCFYIWIQYGIGEVADIVFEDDNIGDDIKQFFSMLDAENVNGAMAVDLTATDANSNRQAQQQMQLQIIQVMMQYLEKVLEAGQTAIQAEQQNIPQLTAMVKEVMRAARVMFTDFLSKHDIRNAEDYIPDLEKFLGTAEEDDEQPQLGGTLPEERPNGGPGGVGGLPTGLGAITGAEGARGSVFG